MNFIFLILLLFTNYCSSFDSTSPESHRVKQETLFGRQVVKNFLIRYPLLKEEIPTKALNRIVSKISKKVGRKDLIYRAGILDTDEILAFSIPGGYILVSRGMIKTWESPASAEFVLAHELSHIYLSHSYEPEDNNSFEKFLQAGLDPTGGTAVAVRALEKKWDTMLKETGREPSQEYESDLSAGYILQELGCNPLAAVNYLNKMDKLTKKSDWIQKTHPSFPERIQRIQKEFKVKQKESSSCGSKSDWDILNEQFDKK
jgi:predicted Zn-dependent protease